MVMSDEEALAAFYRMRVDEVPQISAEEVSPVVSSGFVESLRAEESDLTLALLVLSAQETREFILRRASG